MHKNLIGETFKHLLKPGPASSVETAKSIVYQINKQKQKQKQKQKNRSLKLPKKDFFTYLENFCVNSSTLNFALLKMHTNLEGLADPNFLSL